MFIVKTKDGESYREGQIYPQKGLNKRLVWDDIPQDVKITAVLLTYPFPVRFRKADGTLAEPFSPKLSLSGFNRYFFYNEATIPLLAFDSTILNEGTPELQAKVIGAIDDKAKIVIEARMDKWGNCSIKRYPLKKLEALIKSGLFRKEIIRNGVSLPEEEEGVEIKVKTKK